MNMIHVTNKRSGTLRGIRSFYVGRPSVLGNKFEIGPDGTRKEVIEKYDNWLEQMMQDDSPQRRAIIGLQKAAEEHDIALECWCYPLACHADVIAKHIRSEIPYLF